MPANRYYIWMVLMVLVGSCIEPFHPVIEETQEMLVINGVVTDQPGVHHVQVSRSTPFSDPLFNPVPDCVIRVEDEHGDMKMYEEKAPGIYESLLDASFLAVGKSYRLIVDTPDGNEYQSAFDTLLACSPIDSLYYEVKQQGTSDPELNHNGIQFFTDVTGTSNTSRNYRWLLEETWEYYSTHHAQYIWDGNILLEMMVDSLSRCYMTDTIKELYSASTRFLSVNKLLRHPLNYVSDRTPRLKRRYSLLVKQQSLTNEAFTYWDKMSDQSSETGGLYETQPSSAIGNIFNVNDPNEKVLGCFYATQQRSKRLTMKLVDEDWFFVRGFNYECTPDTIRSPRELDNDYPYYMWSLSLFLVGPPYAVADRICFDCRLSGGVTEIPEYW